MDYASKLSLMVSVVAVFFGVLLLIFFLAAKAKGKAQTPLARLIFLGPAALLVTIGLVIPAIQTTYFSFYNSDGNKFVGAKNYSWIFTTPDNWVFLRNTALWIVITPILHRIGHDAPLVRFSAGAR